jgi:predicted nuclease of predicted toxin-antitoxin system
LSLKLLRDEDSQAQPLVNLLRNANHDVLTVNEAGLMSQPDNIVLDYAIQNNRVLLTRNCIFHNLIESAIAFLFLHEKISYKS